MLHFNLLQDVCECKEVTQTTCHAPHTNILTLTYTFNHKKKFQNYTITKVKCEKGMLKTASDVLHSITELLCTLV